MNRLLIIAVFISLCYQGFSQAQRIRGRVEDKFRAPLSGAGVILLKDSIVAISIADSAGHFIFENVQPGRYGLRVSFTGYQFFQQEILVTSSRVTEIIVSLEEIPNVLEEVEVSARTLNDQPSGQVITIEKTLRVPANFFDPVRVITSYPGVMTANDQNNTIVIRGNSPAGLLWRINGLDVVNPNHLANAGTFSDKPAAYGGGVNIISSQLLDRTDFYAGSLPARYGNALSGVVDMNLREGDKTENHYTLQASLIGLDASAEGPIGKKQNTSFLVNYRYSTVGLLSAMGAKFGDEDIRFQDLTFSMNSDLSKNRKLSLFGFYGSSKNVFEHKNQADWKVDKDQFDIDYDSKNFGIGTTFNQSFRQVNISSGFAVSGSDQQRNQSFMGGSSIDFYEVEKFLVSAFGRINASINSTQLESGIALNYMVDEVYITGGLGGAQGKVEGYLLQPYALWRIFLSEKLIAQTAMRYIYFTYNNSGTLEPRISLEYFPTVQSSFKFSYNLTSQLQQSAMYLKRNKKLDLSKSHRLDLGYTINMDKGLKVSSTVYYQKLFDIPVEKESSSYSALNSIEELALPDLKSSGTGDNYGLELLAEKLFFDKSYFILGGSLYKSLYRGSDNIERHTRFDGGYTVNLTFGKEWTKNKKQSARAFGISSRILYLGGLRETPFITVPGTPPEFITIRDKSRAFENQLKDYFRMDLRLNWRKNKKGYTRTIALDIQNVLNTQNEAYNYYDSVKSEIITQFQLGLIPVLVYRIDF